MIYPPNNFIKELDNGTLRDWLRFQIRANSFKKCKQRNDHISYIEESIVKNNDVIQECPNLTECLEWLNTVPQPEQKTPEWYSYRHSVVTASSASDIFDTSRYQSYLKEKVLPEKHFRAGPPAQHGIKFEPIAQSIYELKTGTTITEYGCIKHKHISHLGASPDGIVSQSNDRNMLGRMLEIKNVYSRELTGIPLYGYWVQCQIQMEVCDLEYCDFLECDMNTKWSRDDFFDKMGNSDFSKYYGIIIEYRKSSDSESPIEYEYSNISVMKESLQNWLDTKSDELLSNENINIENVTYWNLKEMSLVTIRRNRAWFSSVKDDIGKFWMDVETKRKILKDNPDAKDTMFVTNTNKRKRRGLCESDVCLIPDD